VTEINKTMKPGTHLGIIEYTFTYQNTHTYSILLLKITNIVIVL